MADDSQKGDGAEGWQPLIADLEARKNRARAMGGSEKIAKQHGRGQMTARERIDALVDPGSFQELGTLVGDISEKRTLGKAIKLIETYPPVHK